MKVIWRRRKPDDEEPEDFATVIVGGLGAVPDKRPKARVRRAKRNARKGAVAGGYDCNEGDA